MAKYKNSFKVTVNLEPWFSNNYGFTMLHLYEELGGSLARGEMVLIHDGSKKALTFFGKENYGTLTIEKEGGVNYEIPIFIYSKELDNVRNFVNLSFYCGIKDKKFVADLHTSDWTSLDGAIKALYPGKVDIRCESDIQATDLKYYQNRESDLQFITNLCYSWKRNSVFTFGLEGLMIKETRGKLNSYGKVEGELEIHSESQLTQMDNYEFRYQPELYKLPKNPWEDTDGKQGEAKDYTELESINLRVYKKYDSVFHVAKDYVPLLENREYNSLYMDSHYFQAFRVTDQDIPKYKIGDVILYKRESDKTPESKKYPFKYYIVKSNELFISVNDSDYVDEDGRHQSWTTMMLGLEVGGDGGTTIALGTEEDPLDSNE